MIQTDTSVVAEEDEEGAEKDEEKVDEAKK